MCTQGEGPNIDMDEIKGKYEELNARGKAVHAALEEKSLMSRDAYFKFMDGAAQLGVCFFVKCHVCVPSECVF